MYEKELENTPPGDEKVEVLLRKRETLVQNDLYEEALETLSEYVLLSLFTVITLFSPCTAPFLSVQMMKQSWLYCHRGQLYVFICETTDKKRTKP